MNTRENYSRYVKEQNVEGSNEASLYLRVLDLLDGIVARIHLFDLPDFWSIESVDVIEKIYAYAVHFQKKEGSAFLRDGLPPSYGRNGDYSAALKSYKTFLEKHRTKPGV